MQGIHRPAGGERRWGNTLINESRVQRIYYPIVLDDHTDRDVPRQVHRHKLALRNHQAVRL